MKIIEKPIIGYEGLYSITNNGDVISLARVKSNNQPIPRRKLNKSIDSAGYEYVSLYKNNVHKRARVHRIVAIAFLVNKDNKETVNHKDGNKQNNNLSNLEWASFGENKKHSFKVLGEKHWLKGVVGSKNPFSKSVKQICPKTNKVIQVFESTRQVREILGFSQGNVASVCRGERNIANGFKWAYE